MDAPTFVAMNLTARAPISPQYMYFLTRKPSRSQEMDEKSEIHAKSTLLISSVRLTTATIFNLDDHTGMVKSWHRSCMIACCPPHHGSRSRWRRCNSEWSGILHWEERSKRFYMHGCEEGKGCICIQSVLFARKKPVCSFVRSFVRLQGI